MKRKHKWSAAPKRAAGKTQTEQAFEDEVLKARPEVVTYGFEELRFVLGGRFNYTPDYTAVLEDGTVECWEVKPSTGFSLDAGSQPRFKAAAESWAGGLFVWRVAIRRRKRDGGGWELQTYERTKDWP